MIKLFKKKYKMYYFVKNGSKLIDICYVVFGYRFQLFAELGFRVLLDDHMNLAAIFYRMIFESATIYKMNVSSNYLIMFMFILI